LARRGGGGLSGGSNIHRHRTEDAILRALTDLISRELRDPRLGMVSVTRVSLSPDLTHARVYLSSVGGDADEDLDIVRGAAGWLRRELAGRVRMKRAPELKFFKDESLSKEARISELLRESDSDEAEDG